MRSNLLSYEPILELPVGFLHLSSGGDEGIRTLDPLLAGQVLSQLSYTPVFPKVLTPSLKDPSKLNNKPYKDFHPYDYIRSPNIADSP